jgi:Uma2 family endonuclease
MPAILESPPHAVTIADVARISQQLAEDLCRLPLRSEGFSVADYLSLDGNYLVEYANGCLQVLPMPDLFHQALTIVLVRLLDAWAEAHDPAARTAQAPFRMYLSDRLYREPDVALMLGRHAARMQRTRWDGADLAIEIISETNRDHDVATKRADYAVAGIPEYWIVDPEARTVRVLTLSAGASAYEVAGDYGLGGTVTSKLLAGLTIDVAALFLAAERRLPG